MYVKEQSPVTVNGNDYEQGVLQDFDEPGSLTSREIGARLGFGHYALGIDREAYTRPFTSEESFNSSENLIEEAQSCLKREYELLELGLPKASDAEEY